MKKHTLPYLKANSSGIIEIRWTGTHNGKPRSLRKSTKTGDPVKAQVEFSKWLRQEDEAPSALTINAIIDSYLSGHVSENVIAKDRQLYCAQNLRKLIGHVPLAEFGEDWVTMYRNSRLALSPSKRKPINPSTVRRELGMLRAAMNYCATKSKIITPAQVPYIALPRPSPGKNIWLDEKESEELLNCATEIGTRRARLFIRIALETGARKSSILNLKTNLADWREGLIHFRPDDKIEKGKRSGTVPMSDRLKAWIEQDWVCQEYLLEHTGRIEREFQAVIDRFVKRKRWNKDKITPHTLRHTWATLAARAGVDMWQIAGVLHDTLETVTKTYAHHSPEHLRKAVNFREKSLENSAV